jgi:hypothetical protein
MKKKEEVRVSEKASEDAAKNYRVRFLIPLKSGD